MGGGSSSAAAATGPFLPSRRGSLGGQASARYERAVVLEPPSTTPQSRTSDPERIGLYYSKRETEITERCCCFDNASETETGQGNTQKGSLEVQPWIRSSPQNLACKLLSRHYLFWQLFLKKTNKLNKSHGGTKWKNFPHLKTSLGTFGKTLAE